MQELQGRENLRCVEPADTQRERERGRISKPAESIEGGEDRLHCDLLGSGWFELVRELDVKHQVPTVEVLHDKEEVTLGDQRGRKQSEEHNGNKLRSETTHNHP